MHRSFITCILPDTSLLYFFCLNPCFFFSLITILQSHPPTVLECSISLTFLYPFLCVFISHLHKTWFTYIGWWTSFRVLFLHPLPLIHHCFYNLTMLKCIHLRHGCQPLLRHPPPCASTFCLPIFLWQWAVRLPSTPFFIHDAVRSCFLMFP